MHHTELQSKFIYSLIVAGKSAGFANDALQRLFERLTPWPVFPYPEAIHGPCSPFEAVRTWIHRGELLERLQRARTGNYRKLDRALREAIRLWQGRVLDLASCTPAELERIPGVGPKTSRFFIVWTRPEENLAVLDVHVLRWMRGLGYEAPASTPGTKRYAELEKAFISEASKRGLTPRQLDLRIWEAASTAANIIPGG
jgi:hypothetical protein